MTLVFLKSEFTSLILIPITEEKNEMKTKKHLTGSATAEKEAKRAKKQEAKKQKSQKASSKKANNVPDGMTNTGRRTSSVTAQITRQARRFSTAIAPTLTKIEAVHILRKLDEVRVKMNDVAQLQGAIEHYVLRNSAQFDPVELDIINKEGFRIMQASVYPDEIILQEGSKKICEVTLIDMEDTSSLLKIKHPVSGMTVYELRELGGTILIQTNTDELKGARLMTQTSGLSSLFLNCGCAFSKETWSVLTQDKIMANVRPNRSFWSENEIKVRDSDKYYFSKLEISRFNGIQTVRTNFV
ncbi:Protein CBG05904 [Caenorhabditis briggsae]|uniref:Protein CBG05904 n=1 Tax=Caenorhabditis briggsae TaxID=6238 RepID=A8X1D6_CAEBR|nr:Protein CBG05904 [Caenorhabditis briggsae]CAP26446.2 Protein CBG05904 [Caenorhabditis briggsae]